MCLGVCLSMSTTLWIDLWRPASRSRNKQTVKFGWLAKLGMQLTQKSKPPSIKDRSLNWRLILFFISDRCCLLIIMEWLFRSCNEKQQKLKWNNIQSAQNVSSHFEYYENYLCGLDISLQLINEELTAHTWTDTLE